MRTNDSSSGREQKISLALCLPSNRRAWRDVSSLGTRQNTTSELKSCGPKKESRKKTEERRLLNLVLSAVGKGSPTKVDACEEPDFIIQFGAERIGVEVTRL